MYPDDSQKELGAVLSYMTGRSLSKEEIWTALELRKSTYYAQLEKGTLVTADHLRKAAANLGVNAAELLTRYRFIDPVEVTSLAQEIGGPLPSPSPRPDEGIRGPDKTTPQKKRTRVSSLRPRDDALPL